MGFGAGLYPFGDSYFCGSAILVTEKGDGRRKLRLPPLGRGNRLILTAVFKCPIWSCLEVRLLLIGARVVCEIRMVA